METADPDAAQAENVADPDPATELRTARRSWLSVLALVGLIALVGTTIGVAVWLAAMLIWVARTRLWFALVATAATIVVLLALHDYIQLALPHALVPGIPFL